MTDTLKRQLVTFFKILKSKKEITDIQEGFILSFLPYTFMDKQFDELFVKFYNKNKKKKKVIELFDYYCNLAMFLYLGDSFSFSSEDVNSDFVHCFDNNLRVCQQENASYFFHPLQCDYSNFVSIVQKPEKKKKKGSTSYYFVGNNDKDCKLVQTKLSFDEVQEKYNFGYIIEAESPSKSKSIKTI